MRRTPTRESWDESTDDRVRVLLEFGPESSPSIMAAIIERHGFEVRSCEGPDHDHGCDLIENGMCALVDGADVVVNMLSTPLDAPMVLDAVTGLRRPPAVVATDTTAARRDAAARSEVDPSDADGSTEHTSEPARHSPPVTVMHGAVTTATLINSIHDALERSRRPHPVWGDGFC